jgi:alkanesulfonate monooxygenase SsuD/methylene tetrahydromethanopterin reductase-like flavin-dependent oxidoreductase (luciferase family)
VTVTRTGITLPSFRDNADPAIAVAHAAEAAGLDAVFAYDHLFRIKRDGSGELRPAMEAFTLLGAIAVETERIAIGPLVARASLRPPATLAHILDTVQRVSHGRLIAAIGTGDEESRIENETFGLEFGTVDDRCAALRATLAAAMGRGYPVWVGGTSARVRTLAAGADGWNRWGGTPERFAAGAEHVRALSARALSTHGIDSVACVLSWGGLVVMGDTEAAAHAKRDRLDPPPGVIVGGPEQVAERLREYAAAGADWVIVGPVDSSDPENATIFGELVAPLLG